MGPLPESTLQDASSIVGDMIEVSTAEGESLSEGPATAVLQVRTAEMQSRHRRVRANRARSSDLYFARR